MIRKAVAASLLALLLAAVPAGASVGGVEGAGPIDVEVHHSDPDCPACPFDPFPLGVCVRWERLPKGGACAYVDPGEAVSG